MKWKDIALPLEPKRTCPCGKISFDKRSAQGKRNHLMKIGNERHLSIYQCHLSNTWHLTKHEQTRSKASH